MQNLMRAYSLNSVEMFPSYQESLNEWRVGTTFYGDFVVAQHYSEKDSSLYALEDTFKRAFGEWKNSIKYMVELCLVMNHLCWNTFSEGKMEISGWYSDRYYQIKSWIFGEDESGSQRFASEDLEKAFDVLD